MGKSTAVGMLIALSCGTAVAQEFRPIENRQYTIDLYQGAPLGSVRIIGMGGAQVAAAEGSAGATVNPAIAPLRTSTSKGTWDWDWHFDWISPTPGSDQDNNGVPEDASLRVLPAMSLGGLYQGERWGFGLLVTGQTNKLDSERDLRATNRAIEFYGGRSFMEGQVLVGLGLAVSAFEFASTERLFQYTTPSLRVGAIYRPEGTNLRVGATTRFAFGDDDVTTRDDCPPENCMGYILPERAKRPWEVSLGGAYRFGPTLWTSKVDDQWRDERYVLVAADLVVTGNVPRGAGIQAFGDMVLQPSGRDVNVSPRLGAELEAIPGWLRFSAGAYYEPARFLAPNGSEITGRVHGTGGLEGRLFSFGLWGRKYRARLALSFDLAKDYANIALSAGLWH